MFTGTHDLIENMSPASKNEMDGSTDYHQEGAKFPLGGSPYSCQQKKVDLEGGGSHGQNKKHQMPPASVVTRLILIMVWRKLIRNPNTYSSLLGLAWSLISYKYSLHHTHINLPTILTPSNLLLKQGFL